MPGSFLLFVNPFTLFSEAIVNVSACCGYHCNHGKHNVRYHNLLTFPVLGVGSRLTAFALHLEHLLLPENLFFYLSNTCYP